MSEMQTVENLSGEIITADEMKVVDETLAEITNILEEHLAEIHYTIGEIILKNIFDGDSKLAWEINEKEPTGPKITLLKCLEDKISTTFPGAGFRKKTWLYNSINLVLDKHLLSDVPDYEKLTVSHRIELLSVKDPEKKKEMITQIVSEGLSVRDARTTITKTKAESQKIGLLTYIKKPELIEDPNVIILKGGKIKEEALKEAVMTIEGLKEEIDRRELSLKKLKRLKERLEKYEPKRGRPS